MKIYQDQSNPCWLFTIRSLYYFSDQTCLYPPNQKRGTWLKDIAQFDAFVSPIKTQLFYKICPICSVQWHCCRSYISENSSSWFPRNQRPFSNIYWNLKKEKNIYHRKVILSSLLGQSLPASYYWEANTQYSCFHLSINLIFLSYTTALTLSAVYCIFLKD